MFIIDDILMSPFKGLMFIAKEVAKAAEQQAESDRANAMAQLSALHLQLEQGEITEEEFDEREAELLDILDAQGESE
jgi:uncharacterized membrane protein